MPGMVATLYGPRLWAKTQDPIFKNNLKEKGAGGVPAI
jgi:hypothetical protein